MEKEQLVLPKASYLVIYLFLLEQKWLWILLLSNIISTIAKVA